MERLESFRHGDIWESGGKMQRKITKKKSVKWERGFAFSELFPELYLIRMVRRMVKSHHKLHAHKNMVKKLET